MMQDPMISIVIPVYNGADYLAQAIDSVLAQTYHNYEVLVVNDGSNDDGRTCSIARSYGDRIRYFEKENGGVSTALNLGIEQMRGEYFSWLSHDDFYYPEKLESQINALRDCGEPKRIVISDYAVLDQETGQISHFHMQEMFSKRQLENALFSVFQGLVSGCAMLIHREHFARVGLFDPALRTTQDYQKWFEMFRGQVLVHVAHCTTVMRVHTAQGSRTIAKHNVEQNALWLRFATALPDEEILSMYPSKSVFYSQLLALMYGQKMMQAYHEVNKLYLQEPDDLDSRDAVLRFQRILDDISNTRAKNICIFGAGIWGNRLYQELTCRLVQVDFFCDNDVTKHGKAVEGVPCLSLDELAEKKADTLIIVATARPDPILEQLHALQFPYITTRQKLMTVLFETPRIKWVSALESLLDVQSISPEAMPILQACKRVVFDICCHYEGK